MLKAPLEFGPCDCGQARIEAEGFRLSRLFLTGDAGAPGLSKRPPGGCRAAAVYFIPSDDYAGLPDAAVVMVKMHRPGGKPSRFLLGIVSVMTRRSGCVVASPAGRFAPSGGAHSVCALECTSMQRLLPSGGGVDRIVVDLAKAVILQQINVNSRKWAALRSSRSRSVGVALAFAARQHWSAAVSSVARSQSSGH